MSETTTMNSQNLVLFDASIARQPTAVVSSWKTEPDAGSHRAEATWWLSEEPSVQDTFVTACPKSSDTAMSAGHVIVGFCSSTTVMVKLQEEVVSTRSQKRRKNRQNILNSSSAVQLMTVVPSVYLVVPNLSHSTALTPTLSVALGNCHMTVANTASTSVGDMMSDGHIITGGSRSTTITVKEQLVC